LFLAIFNQNVYQNLSNSWQADFCVISCHLVDQSSLKTGGFECLLINRFYEAFEPSTFPGMDEI